VIPSTFNHHTFWGRESILDLSPYTILILIGHFSYLICLVIAGMIDHLI
jgi:hypothetical protein